jgi:hypothetical protein
MKKPPDKVAPLTLLSIKHARSTVLIHYQYAKKDNMMRQSRWHRNPEQSTGNYCSVYWYSFDLGSATTASSALHPCTATKEQRRV